tara:strand:+ start:246 stop:635 length:390 start_codon:yes stop_codon:yes gene_type:complete
MINQLFKKTIPQDLLEKVLSCFNLKNLDDAKIFTKYDLELNNTVNNLNALKTELFVYYIPCKAKVYLNDITPKKCITILRQILRLYNYSLHSSEKYIAKKKKIAYQMTPNDKTSNPTIINQKNTIITFD